ncbi:YjeF N-terminal domain-containing protein [Melampsora americana]|nr:YjeF N-terminal domain-containing protein [Melampsora americana]
MSITYLDQLSAQSLDIDLMSPEYGYTIDQLMELAGLACAQALHSVYPKSTHPNILVCCGPGNQGGDGLVAARHLFHFGYKVVIYYPKQTNKESYKRLLKQCETLEIECITLEKELDLESRKEAFEKLVKDSNVILDTIFGFSFKGMPRDPFDFIISYLKNQKIKPPIISVDIPSGWDIELGDPNEDYFVPEVLISLTMPKLGSKTFKGIHLLGGRFLPPKLAQKYKLNVPIYPGSVECLIFRLYHH